MGRGCGRNETYCRKSIIIIYSVFKSFHTGRLQILFAVLLFNSYASLGNLGFIGMTTMPSLELIHSL